MKRQVSVPGKIILSGEYAVVFDYRGVAMPSQATIDLHWTPGSQDFALQSTHPDWHSAWNPYVQDIFASAAASASVPAQGTLEIGGNLPLGKGMGSSTALVVAMTELCECPPSVTQSIEDRVNPGHSGLDLAVISSRSAVAYRQSEGCQPLTSLPPWINDLRLFDSGQPNEPTPELVAWIRSRSTGLTAALKTIDACSAAFIAGNAKPEILQQHYRAQCELGVVTPPVQEFIHELERLGGSGKVIGAGGRTGGSGMVLTYHPIPETLDALGARFGFAARH